MNVYLTTSELTTQYRIEVYQGYWREWDSLPNQKLVKTQLRWRYAQIELENARNTSINRDSIFKQYRLVERKISDWIPV